MSINTVRTHAQTHAHSYAYVQDGKGVFDHTEEIQDEKKRAAVLALMAEYSVLCAVATGKADLVAAAVAKGCTVNETDQEGNSCLHIAAAKGNNEILRMLLNAGAKVSAKNKAGYTSVQLALEQKHEATVEVLLEAIVAAGMDIDARYESRRERGQTLLMRASALGLTSTAAKLLALGADIAAKDAAGRRALELAKDDATFEALKAGGATMSDMTQQEKNDLLIEYVKKGLAGGLLMALQAGADVNHKGPNSWTDALAQALLGAGADVNAKDRFGQTPMFCASSRPDNREVDALLRQHSRSPSS